MKRTLPDTPPQLESSGPVMMLDDDPLDLHLARRCHARSGITRPLTTFDRPQALFDHLDAVARGEATTPALLLVDVSMPAMNGFEVVRRVRSNPAFADRPPIAMFSTSSLEEDREAARALGCAAYLVKPPTTRRFVQLFEKMGP